MMSNYEVKLLDSSSIRQQVEVFICAFETEDTIENVIEYWKKKHYGNPVHASYVFGVFDESKLVSINAYMPMEYTFDDRKCKVIQSCESGTIPEYRGKGIWSKVVTFAVNYFIKEQEYDFLIGFPNFENSFGGFMKMNWNHVADMINYIMIGDGKEFFKTVTKGRKVPFGGLCSLQRFCLPFYAYRNFQISEEVSDECVPLKGFSLCDSKEFIEWKKNYKNLKEFGVKDSKGDIIAVCRYFLGDYNGNKVVYLCNIKSFKQDYRIKNIYALCIREILKRNPKVAFIRAWATKGSDTEIVFRKLFFIKSKHHNPFITYQLKDNLISNERISNINNWKNISFIDLD